MFLLPYEINSGSLKYSKIKDDHCSQGQFNSENIPNKQGEYLTFTTSDDKPSGNGERVDSTLIPVPLPDYSPLRYINSNNLPSLIFSKRESSLIAHFNLFSSILHLRSCFCSILRI